MSRYQTRGVLAGAYRGKRAALNATLTHLVDTLDASGGFDALCGKVKRGNMADEYADPEGNAKKPNCVPCALRWREVRQQLELNAGDLVRCAYRGEHEGVVLARDDPRAWRQSLAFPVDAPDPEAVKRHVNAVFNLLQDKHPVLWMTFGTLRVYWDSQLTKIT